MNIKPLTELLGFEQLKNMKIWRKKFASCELRVDFANEQLIYPEAQGFTVNERQTCNFSAPENFVVFECVYRLLSKGYKPQHIELEPKWKLGHGPSGGRADILVKDNKRKAFLIIECKTYGGEFDGEWREMLLNGGQLFSYFQQVQSTQYICLYASDIIDGVCVYNSNIIAVKDNPEYLKSMKKPLSFASASDVRALFSVWRDTYKQEYETQGIFENSVGAYEIGKAKHTADDLQEISHDDIQKKYHAFATILRQHNVSGRENAFDKLVNLFLAKIVDETQNPDELLFYWKGVAFDDYYSLQDRIQRLYRDGMQKFLGEIVTYIDNSAIENAFHLFKNDPDATRETILDYFRQLKFYTNNDFAFLDVHNEQLFFQNAAILLKIVRMLQNIRLKTQEQNQFLGDLFEGFLDQGVKQSEGQFFTPTPIVKFLVSSLPLETLIAENAEPLNVIDYACGAGHFLNEYATQIRAYLEPERLYEYYGRVVGIEKEYRLSKVAKVSAFMYGQDNIQIVYADALAAGMDKNGTYNVLISNPPYSVKGFLETLSDEEREAFEITKVINNKNIITNNSIEVFFVERAKQLLAPNGVAAIILPSSLLSNSGAIYTKAREIILQHFDIVAVAEMESGTFGKTGTNTVTMFLRRKAETPSLAEHYRNRVEAWYGGNFDFDDVFEDSELLTAYCEHVQLDRDTVIADDKHKEKLYYFMLALSNPQDVVVVKSPAGTNESKKFLGYEWSNRKGSEGIKYIGVGADDDEDDKTLSRLKGIRRINTPLFNPNDLADASKINSIVRANFAGIIASESEFVTRHRLVDMLDYSGAKFEKQISLTAAKVAEIESTFPLEAISTHFEYSSTRIESASLIVDNYVGVDNMIQNRGGKRPSDFVPQERAVTKYILGDVLLSNIRPYLKKIWLADTTGGCSNDVLVLHPLDDVVQSKYLYYVLSQDAYFQYVMQFKKGVKMPRGDKDKIMQYKIPIPPRDIQEKIIASCEAVDGEYSRTRMSIDEYRRKIETLFADMEIITTRDISLNDSRLFILSIGKRVLDSQLVSDGEVPVYSANVYEPFGYVDKRLITDFQIPSVLWGIDGDWQVNYLPADIEFYPTDHCGVLRVLTDEVNPRCLAWALEKAGSERGFSRTLRASIDRVKRLNVKLPPIEKQQEVAEEVIALEAKIAAAQSTLASLDGKLQGVLDSYLQ
ncbi:MAG: N-6 DNA methylase [Synergistaceae bacterium]|jgi:type I restriction-modification system DNA methylase subunit/restriction endonuclease S subunit|nr:N-6 DNA methylase [Synergistaceae bacterium]